GKLLGGGEETGEGRFGSSVALSADGTSALVGAPGDEGNVGAAWSFARSGSSWSQQGPKLTASGEFGEGEFGYSAALSADGGTALIGAPHDATHVGSAWTFARTDTTWSQQEEEQAGIPEPPRLLFAAGLALSADGGTALLGAPREAHSLGGVWAYLGSSTTTPPPGEGVPPPSGEGPPTNPVTKTDATGNAPTGNDTPLGGVLASTASALPPPVLGVAGNVVRLSGIVRVKLPGSRHFVLLTAGAQIPFGSIVDARRGRVSVTTA